VAIDVKGLFNEESGPPQTGIMVTANCTSNDCVGSHGLVMPVPIMRDLVLKYVEQDRFLMEILMHAGQLASELMQMIDPDKG
jgi:hypothetical protein